ncbi:unnamed protein product [Haemonchus placei]|uniref:Transposase n=1 Tax=Haemonchus placei TaxID=6290 RepID=A0A0N4VUW5_HAEPC|nr:unnamed protein product [Haemonchus placei]
MATLLAVRSMQFRAMQKSLARGLYETHARRFDYSIQLLLPVSNENC